MPFAGLCQVQCELAFQARFKGCVLDPSYVTRVTINASMGQGFPAQALHLQASQRLLVEVWVNAASFTFKHIFPSRILVYSTR